MEGEQNQMEQKRRPEANFRAGGINAAVWRNEGKDGRSQPFFSVSLDKRYKDKTGAWQSTSSLSVNDLPRAALVLSEAFKYVVTRGREGLSGSTAS